MGTEGHGQTILLALRRTVGHSREDITSVLIDVVRSYGIDERISYFIADNASENDQAIRIALSKLRPDLDHPESYRARCMGHIINLTSKVIIEGKIKARLTADQSLQEGDDDEEEEEEEVASKLAFWRQYGLIGKLHNICVFIRKTPERRAVFESFIGPNLDESTKLMVIMDTSTRWNSMYESWVRALKLQSKIQAFCRSYSSDLGQDLMTNEDWATVEQLRDLLEPMYFRTKALGGSGVEEHHGVIWKALPTMEFLLNHLEEQKRKHPASEGSLISVCIAQGWLKLRKYYNLTDQQHHLYAAAVILNPCMKMQYFEKNWGKMKNFSPISVLSEMPASSIGSGTTKGLLWLSRQPRSWKNPTSTKSCTLIWTKIPMNLRRILLSPGCHGTRHSIQLPGGPARGQPSLLSHSMLLICCPSLQFQLNVRGFSAMRSGELKVDGGYLMMRLRHANA